MNFRIFPSIFSAMICFHFHNYRKHPYFLKFLFKLQLLTSPQCHMFHAILNTSHQNHFSFKYHFNNHWFAFRFLFCFFVPNPLAPSVHYVFLQSIIWHLKKCYILFLYFLFLFCVSYHLSNIVSSWKTRKLMCVSFGFFKGTWYSVFSEGLMKKDQKTQILCQHFYSLTLCKACLDFLGLLFLILELVSFRKSIVRSVLAVRIPVLFCQCLLQSNTFFFPSYSKQFFIFPHPLAY